MATGRRTNRELLTQQEGSMLTVEVQRSDSFLRRVHLHHLPFLVVIGDEHCLPQPGAAGYE